MPDTLTIQTAAWNAIAKGYDDIVTPSHFWLGEEGVETADLRSGMSFLDVAAGTGALSIPAARIGADVTATDISPAMLEGLERRAEAEGLSIQTRLADGHALGFEDGTFDVAGSQFGVMLLEDAPRAIREMRRVVKPGGTVLLTVYGDPRDVDFLRFFAEAVRSVRPDFQGLPTDPPPLPFQFSDPEVLRKSLEDAGLRSTRITSITEWMEFRDGSALYGWLLSSNPIPGAILDQLEVSEDERRVMRETLSRMVRERAAGQETARLASPVHVAVATK